MSGAAAPLAELTARLLEREGAAVEHVGSELLEILAPQHVQRALELPELGWIGFGSEPVPGARQASLESDFVERLAGLLGDRGRHALVAVSSAGPRPSSPERLLEQALVLDNATYRLAGVEHAWTTYVVPTFRWVARSDDQREGLLSFGLNAGTSSVLSDPAPLLDAPRAPCGNVASDVPRAGAEQVARVASCIVPDRIEERLAPFLAGMRRRLRRDVDRLHDYYGALRAEALTKRGRPASEPDVPEGEARLRREDQRLASIAREHRAKLDDLRHRYALVVEVSWLQTLEIVAPVHRLDVEIRRRKRMRRIALDVNPFTRRLEPPPCEHRYLAEGARAVCDDALHLVGRSGLAPCPACGKPYCRACHPAQCPRCRRPG